MKRLNWLLGVFPLFLTGCLVVSYPTWSQTPLLPLKAPSDEISAFRIYVTETCLYERILLKSDYEYSLAKTSTFAGMAMPQTLVTADFVGMVSGLGATTFHHTLQLRLYRPGFETVGIHSWDLNKEIIWRKAEGIMKREKAIDDLLSGPRGTDWITSQRLMQAKLDAPEFTRTESKTVEFNLKPGSESRAHKQALLFGADEYERLAASFAATNDELRDTQVRLLAKAAWLRKRAAE